MTNIPKRGFILEHKNGGDEISFGMIRKHDNIGICTMKWRNLGGKNTPQLQVFDDGWKVLAMFDDVIQVLAKYDNRNITITKFMKILKQRGFEYIGDLDLKDLWK